MNEVLAWQNFNLYVRGMTPPSAPKELGDTLELMPSKAQASRFVLHFKEVEPAVGEQMTSADWDQFEEDIRDAFERIP